MSSLQVTAEPLTILEHPNADALELAQVGLYRAVVAKGTYRTGQYAVYIPEQAILPAELVGELGLTGKLAGAAGNRIKPIRLRGELSQGVVCLPQQLRGIDLAAAHAAGTDFADPLGVTKWVPEVPIHMSGRVEPAADLLRWIDIENAKRYPTVFAAGESVTATEKVHGTCSLATWVAATGTLLVSSKGFGEQGLALVEEPGNLYWRAVRGHGVDVAAATLAEQLGASRVGIYGEVYGAGVQDLTYGETARVDAPGYAAFDVYAEIGGTGRWLSQDELVAALSTLTTPVPTVPRLYEGPYDEQLLLELAEGREQLSGQEVNIREGVVVRPVTERTSDVLGGRAIVKFVGAGYLLRKGGSEYQ